MNFRTFLVYTLYISWGTVMYSQRAGTWLQSSTARLHEEQQGDNRVTELQNYRATG